MTETNHTLVVGADIGGAKAASGLVNRDGEIRMQTRIPMVANGDAGDGVAAVLSAIDFIFASDAKARTLIQGALT
jgi:predicted NBD/HSP70 family sugar kinase